MKSQFNNYEHWRDHVRATIFAQYIALQCRDWMREGRGGVTPEAMAGFVEEAGAVADLWLETVPP